MGAKWELAWPTLDQAPPYTAQEGSLPSQKVWKLSNPEHFPVWKELDCFQCCLGLWVRKIIPHVSCPPYTRLGLAGVGSAMNGREIPGAAYPSSIE